MRHRLSKNASKKARFTARQIEFHINKKSDPGSRTLRRLGLRCLDFRVSCHRFLTFPASSGHVPDPINNFDAFALITLYSAKHEMSRTKFPKSRSLTNR